MRKLICIVTVCFLMTTLFSGCGVLQKLGFGNNDNDELTPVSSIAMNEDEARQLSDKVPVNLYFATSDNKKLKLEIRYIPMTDAKKTTKHLAETIVKELMAGPKKSGTVATIPEGVKLRGVTVNDNIATVDFSKEFISNHKAQGKEAEQMTIYSIVNTLTEIKEIEKVKFLINGKKEEKFKGFFKFDASFPRTPSLITKAVDTENEDTALNTEDSSNESASDDSILEDTGSLDADSDLSEDADILEGGDEDTYVEVLE